MTSLLLAPLALAGLWWASRSSAVDLPAGRRRASLLLRSLAVLLLAAGLGRPSLSLAGDRPWLTVFVADVSDSVPAGAWSKAVDELRRAWERETAAGNRCALVAFAGRAETLVPPSTAPLAVEPWRLAHRAALDAARGDAARITEIERWRDLLHVGETDPEAGVRAARALFQESAASRLVFLSDGRLPAGASFPAGAAVVSLETGPRRDLAVIDVQAPTAVRAGEPFDVRVTIDSTGPADATLTLSLDDRAVPEAARKLRLDKPGRRVIVLPNIQQSPALAAGLHRLLVVAASPGDDEPRNNAATAVTAVVGKPRVLLIEGRPPEGEFLARVFAAQDIDVMRESPAAAAGRAGSLEEFSAVVMAGVARTDVAPELEKALLSYVERSGGGFWMLGSPALAGPAGWAGSALERLLPVAFTETAAGSTPRPPPANPEPTPPTPAPPPDDPNPPGELRRVLAPAAAVLFLIDKSGSMAGPPIEIVKAACIESAGTLTGQDLVGVIAFDSRPRPVLEFVEADRQGYIQNRISRVFADGSTNIYPALVDAHRSFLADGRARRCSAKHVILLSDGDTAPGDFETVARDMRRDGISVSTVCVGAAQKFDAALMSQIAFAGGGRFFYTNSYKNVPKLFLQEVAKILGPVNQQRAVPPAAPPAPAPKPPVAPPAPVPGPAPAAPARMAVVAKDAHETLQGVDTSALPGLYGRLEARAREAAGVAVPLVFADGKPLLALGRAGLGRTASWTSDLASPWSRDWHGWKDAGKLAAQVMRSLAAAPPDLDFAARARVSVSGRTARLRVDPGAPGEALSAFDGESRQPLPLGRDGDGGSTLELALDRPGELRRLLLQKGDGPAILLGAVRTSDEEFIPAPSSAGGAKATDWAGLERDLSGGRLTARSETDVTPWLAGLAALLLALDVAVRRFSS